MCVSTHFKLITKVTSGGNKEGLPAPAAGYPRTPSVEKFNEKGPVFTEGNATDEGALHMN